VNNLGDVVGNSETSGGKVLPFRWRSGAMVRIKVPMPATAVAVNDRGDIAMDVVTDDGNDRAALWRKGKLTVLGTLDGTWSAALMMNDSGDIAGVSPAKGTRGDYRTRGFLWQSGEMVRLPDQGFSVIVHDINNRGDVVGGFLDAEGLYAGGALWRNGHLIKLAPPFGSRPQAVATDVNDNGQVLGSFYVPAVDSWNGFLWDDGVYTDLGVVTGMDINDRGEIAMTRYNDWSWGQAVRWVDGQVTVLPTLGTPDTQVRDINEQGLILGNAMAPDETLHGVVWTSDNEIVDLGVLNGQARYLNDRGRVVAIDDVPTPNGFRTHVVVKDLDCG
jgi:probable HAF family extracellular repeat protein